MQAAAGRWNRLIGWTLLVAGFAWAAWLDPWSLSEHDPAPSSAAPAWSPATARPSCWVWRSSSS